MYSNHIDIILSLINEKRNRCTTRVLVALDGAGGAGKSTLARQLRDRCSNAAIIEMDNFYRPEEMPVRRAWTPQEGYQKFFDWKRLRDQVLEPLRSGRYSEYQVYDWISNSLSGWRNVPLDPVIIIEGVYSLRPELRSVYHISLFVETPKEICLNRLRSRTDKEEDIQMWRAAEEWYFDNIMPQKNCDLIIEGC